MKNSICILFGCLVLTISPAHAVDWQAQWQACMSVKDSLQRLSCFENMGQHQKKPQVAVDAKPALPPVPAKVAPAPAMVKQEKAALSAEQKFGQEKQIAKKEAKELEEIKAKVVSVSKAAYGNLTFTLDNKQRWQTKQKGPKIKKGNVVIISRGSLGSFYVKKEGSNRQTRVKRLD